MYEENVAHAAYVIVYVQVLFKTSNPGMCIKYAARWLIVVEYLTRDGGVAGSSLIGATALCH